MDYFGLFLLGIFLAILAGHVWLASRLLPARPHSTMLLRLAALALVTTIVWIIAGAVTGYLAVQHDDAFYTGVWTMDWYRTLWSPFSLSYSIPPLGAILGQSTAGIALAQWLWFLLPITLFALALISNRITTRRTGGKPLAHA